MDSLLSRKEHLEASSPHPRPPPPASTTNQTQRHPPAPPLPSDTGVVARTVSQLEHFFPSSGHAVPSASPHGSNDSDFRPGYFFFYGTLMDPEVLQTVLKLPQVPTLQECYITGFRIKLWGIYPALISSANDSSQKVYGRFWNVCEVNHVRRLAVYETNAYKMASVTIRAEVDGASIVILGGRTFCWAGEESSPDLTEGSFDLERYQRYFKPSVVRPE